MNVENLSDDWSLEDHLTNGAIAITAFLARFGNAPTDPRVCFHFSPLKANEDDPWGEDATYARDFNSLPNRLKCELEVDCVGGFVGVEVWERVVPSLAWLESRIPDLFDIAKQTKLSFDGWSFEPLKPRESCFVCGLPSLNVVHVDTPAGAVALEEMKREFEDSATRQFTRSTDQ
jgi:hypothetical protein